MTKPQPRSFAADFRQFFLRGLAIVLPTVLTIWILVAVYRFVDVNIAEPINGGVKELILNTVSWPQPAEEDFLEVERNLSPKELAAYEASGRDRAAIRSQARREALNDRWEALSIGGWTVANLFGLVVAVVLIYMIGLVLGSFIGRRLYARGEEMFRRVPIIKQVYPYVKQVTDFLVGEGDASKPMFNKVVAVEYPRKGIWSVGLLTGETMQTIEDHAAEPCVTVFVPSSPTPFTGYVITVPRKDTVDLPVTIEQAIRFTVSGGVIIPEGQVIGASATVEGKPAGRSASLPPPAGRSLKESAGDVDRSGNANP